MLELKTNSVSTERLERLKKFGDKVNETGASFGVCDSAGQEIIICNSGNFSTNWNSVFNGSLSFIRQRLHTSQQTVYIVDENILAAILKINASVPQLVAVIDLNQKISIEDNTDSSGDSRNMTGGRDRKDILSEMLALLAEKFRADERLEKQAGLFTAELSEVYEELDLFFKLSSNMKVSNTDFNYLQMACNSLTGIIDVEGIVILLDKNIDEEKQWFLAAGAGLFDFNEQMRNLLYERVVAEIELGKEVLIDSEVEGQFKYSWPENIRSVIAIPLYGKDRINPRFSDKSDDNNYIIGLMAAINRIGKPDFDSADIKLFNSVATNCAVFIENGRLFSDLKELFIGSLKALTNSIDAKDQYTRGHSERVAFIARWIAERYAEKKHLEEEQIRNIYLSGLLHDIGKIGIDEAVLRKQGKLTEEEIKCIRKHPLIGAGILSEIKQMRDIIPGVLCHHERIDGTGYPNGLSGPSIPLEGKIVGLADSFDAMTSVRIYRPAMSLEETLEQIRKGLGTQFDEEIGKIFLNSDIYHLWHIMQNGLTDKFGIKDFSEYGTEAIEALIK